MTIHVTLMKLLTELSNTSLLFQLSDASSGQRISLLFLESNLHIPCFRHFFLNIKYYTKYE